MNIRSPQQLIELLDAKPVIVLEEIQKALNSASRATVFRYLMKVNYRRSYNHNGRYYTKHDLTRYDKYGIFSYKGIHFSCDGNLVLTIMRLVCDSSAGHTQRELQELLKVRVQTSLASMVHNKKLARAKVAGNFIYLHPDSKSHEAQLIKRCEILEKRRFSIEAVTDAVVIEVLLILIRHPGSKAGDVARRLKGHSPPITIQHIRVVFDRYYLDDDGEKKIPSGR
ncbi:MAG: hypothetical protein PF482_11150 [Desulfobacteraceae bacterium]|nr:hypothetical protein [Desulfobacteraceae bacterium]